MSTRFWWVDLPMKAYDEQMVEEKKSKRWGASWALQSKEIRCGWFTLYKQKTNWSPERRKNGREIHCILRKQSITKGQQAFMFEEENEKASVAYCVQMYDFLWRIKNIFVQRKQAYVTSLACFWRAGWLFGRKKKRKSSTIKDLALSFLHVSDESSGCTRLVIFYPEYQQRNNKEHLMLYLFIPILTFLFLFFSSF